MKNHEFRPISRCISEMIQDMAIVTMEDDKEQYSYPTYRMVPFSMTLNEP